MGTLSSNLYRVVAALLVSLCLMPSPTVANAITRTEIHSPGGNDRLIFRSDTQLGYKKLFTLASPDRVVIDLPALTNSDGVELPSGYNGTLVRGVRHGRFDPTTSRIVIDLAAPVAKPVLQTMGSEGDWQLVIDLVPQGGVMPTPMAGAKPTMVAKPSPVPPSKPTATKTTILPKDDQKPLIVIDAGHGGKDPGASGSRGTIEKKVTLNYAKALRTALLRTGRYRVLLTREDDRFLFLPQRVAIARQAKGDLFISLHADTNPAGNARGLSIYTLSDTASDAQSAALAAQENKADIISGMDLNEEDIDVANILIDLAQRETRNKSSELAETIVGSMDRKVTLLTNPHRFAGFRVLKAPDIPSVLIELGFLSNEKDEKMILSREYQERAIAGIIKGVDGYFQK